METCRVFIAAAKRRSRHEPALATHRAWGHVWVTPMTPAASPGPGSSQNDALDRPSVCGDWGWRPQLHNPAVGGPE
jgi:hypothetical protein